MLPLQDDGVMQARFQGIFDELGWDINGKADKRTNGSYCHVGIGSIP
jgi:hypothetical protein